MQLQILVYYNQFKFRPRHITVSYSQGLAFESPNTVNLTV